MKTVSRIELHTKYFRKNGLMEVTLKLDGAEVTKVIVPLNATFEMSNRTMAAGNGARIMFPFVIYNSGDVALKKKSA